MSHAESRWRSQKMLTERTTQVVCGKTRHRAISIEKAMLLKNDRYTLHQQDAKAHVWATTVINFFIKVVYLYNTALKIVSYTRVLQLGENGLPIARLPSKYKICSEENRITDGTMDPQRHYVQRDIGFYRLFYYTSNKMQRYTVYVIWILLYMFQVVPPPIIRSANNCIYSIW